MKAALANPEFDSIPENDKEFILRFDEAMRGINYNSSGLRPYICFGKYMVEYTKPNVKSKKCVARFYLRDDEIVLRLYFSNIDKHAAYLEQAPAFIQSSFTGEEGLCRDCRKGLSDGKCKFQKNYSLHGKDYKRCNGETFYFHHFSLDSIPAYIELLTTFYPDRRKK